MPLPGGRVILVQGASRGIGLALVQTLREREPESLVLASCRNPESAGSLQSLCAGDDRVRAVGLDVEDADSIARAAETIAALTDRLDLVINCAGILHGPDGMAPERRLAEVRPERLGRSFQVNALGALLVAQAMEPLLRRGDQPRLASLSARVGSIADNRLGGWYAYRASKAALNMLMRTLSIEWARGSRPIAVTCLHPGTVATELSAPFVGDDGSARGVFSPTLAAAQLLDVLAALRPEETGNFLAWDGTTIPW